MPSVEVAAILTRCVRAFHQGSVLATRLQARDDDRDNPRQPSQRELFLQEMLQESMNEGQSAIISHFDEEQRLLGTHGYLLQAGDDTARQELLLIALALQEEILEKIGSDIDPNRSLATDLKSLYETAVAKRHEAIRSITELRKRLESTLPVAGSSAQVPLPARQHSTSTIITPSVPVILTDDSDARTMLTYDDDRYTIAPERPIQAVSMVVPVVPQPLHVNRFSFSSAASMRAAAAPESVPGQQMQPLAQFESLGPYFPPRSSAEGHSDHNLPTLVNRSRRDRPSVPDSQIGGPSDGLPWANRIFSNVSLPSPSSSPRISEPDSAISIKSRSTKPYCSGAIAAQEKFVDGFFRPFLPILPESEKREQCWKCKECAFNASDGDAQLLDRIEFRNGVRFRFMFLAKSHIPYQHPKEAIKPRYQYGCLFCTAEGKQSSTHGSVDSLMSHIRDKHQTNLTPEVKEKTKCIVGRLADRQETWDCNLPDVNVKKNGMKKFFIHAVTALPT